MRGFLLGLLAALLIVAGGFGYYVWDAAQGVSSDKIEETYLEAQDRFVEVDGLNVRVRESGPKDAPVLLMLHGFTFSLESYDAIAANLERDFRVVRYDLRGHGLTGPDPEKRYSPDQRADHIGAVMDALSIERATVIGNSLGGLASWRFAAKHPERVDALVLISPGAYPINGVGEEAAPVPPAVEAYLRLAPIEGVEASVSRIYADPASVPRRRVEEIHAMMRREGNGAAFVDALNVFTLPDPEPMLRSIESPTLIIWGVLDQVISAEHGTKMAAVMPNARLLLLDGVGHVAHEEAPGRVSDEIRSFVAASAAVGG